MPEPGPNSTKILVVEDEFLIRLVLAEALADEGYDVLEAETGEAAMSMLEADGSVGLLLTDMQLPGRLDGRALAASARRVRPDLPVIFTSGRPDTQAHGPREVFVAKPYLPSDILAAVRRMTAPPVDGGTTAASGG